MKKRNNNFKQPSLAVDALIIKDEKLLLIKRKKEPFSGFYALPGGFVQYGERIEEAVMREVKEETGLDVQVQSLVGVYSDPRRDPRGHIISICYLCRLIGGKLSPNKDEIEEAGWFLLKKLPLPLAFDHQQIVQDYLAL